VTVSADVKRSGNKNDAVLLDVARRIINTLIRERFCDFSGWKDLVGIELYQ
jgi:hypothetical protein